jgi:ferric enterobactin receptor
MVNYNRCCKIECYLRFVLVCGLISGYASLSAQTRAVSGRVIDANTGERLPYATIVVQGTKMGTQSNVEGFFLLQNVPDTSLILQVTYMGYASKEVAVDPATSATSIIIRLAQTSIDVEGVTVSAAQIEFIKTETVPSLTTLSPAQIATLPNVGQVDVMRSLQLLPGISATDDGSSGLYVRGGTPDQNLILFDGMTVYHVDHFFGFFSAFNPDAIKDIQIYKGAFPAKFGGRLSSVIDMVGKSGNTQEFHGTAGLSLLSGNATIEGPLLGGSFLVSARRSYSDIIASGTYNTLYKFLTGTNAPQASNGSQGFGGFGNTVAQQQTPNSAFLDLNAKLSYNITSQYIVSTSAYASNDNYDLSQQSSTQNVPGFGSRFTVPSNSNNTQQGNKGASIKLFAQWSDNFYSNIILAYDGYTSTYTSSLGSRTGGSQQFATNEDNHIDDGTFSIDDVWKTNPFHELGFGLSLTQTKLGYALSGATQGATSRNILELDQQGLQNAVYVQDTWSQFDRLTLTGGLRANFFSVTNAWSLEPRFSLRYQLTENVSLKAAFGIHHQYANRIVNEDITQGSRDFWILADDSLPPSKAIHYVVGATWENENYAVDVEGYYKYLNNLVEFTQRFRRQALDLYTFLIGDGRVRGIDVLLQKKTGTLNGWISYTLGKAESRYPEYNNAQYFPSDDDQTNELKVVANVDIGSGWNASATFIYATGKPYTAPVSQYSLVLLDSATFSYTHVSQKNAYRLPAYQRTDISVSKKFRLESSSLDVGLSLFNLFNHTNISYYQYDLTSQPIIITKVTGLGFLPSVFVQYEF